VSIIEKIGLSGRFRKKALRGPNYRRAGVWWHLKQFCANRWRELPLWLALGVRRLVPGMLLMHSSVRLAVIHADGSVTDYGVVGRHLIVTAGKNFVAGAFVNAVTNNIALFKFHGLGTGTTAAAVGDTALQTELTTAYNPDNTRATGSQSSATNVYTTVGTNTVDAAAAVTEWGLFTQAATGGGTLLDRQVFSVINLAVGDSLQVTYNLTCG
jgi:hypothetical protein